MSQNVKLSRQRRVRRRRFEGLTRGLTKGAPRLKYLDAWLARVSSGLAGTGTVQTLTAAGAVMTVTGHGYSDGSGPLLLKTTGTLPAGLETTRQYWCNELTANTISLHYNQSEALRGVNAIDTTDGGTGSHTIEPDETELGLSEQLRNGNAPELIAATTDIDDLV